ncbi:ribose 1,5-bisphosphate isomerase [Candidatus Desantisbacteria bacterium CG_4_10_14_3_um_filter_40_18]|uniref:Thiamine thiazole synthase n=2 Tax=unclassified Candidatus Desantisiibacteriota TaxID=3106372 RepID=A0A2M7P152_9BACT|nr:MAG: ribose 1,5-bisphosphate isomerase [Candidatus Desantisbacteria bacterium CG23_combo_of_CG06-09_8_20_14_all_40_23]PIY19385.1 MAG: ribose 1,5-bisphosphate isomerase [Candidatus Desantisbacteria bacterium CG_4_10_14_3_um_filter_40_18]
MPIFSKISEKDVTRAIVSSFNKQFIELVESDCLIVGAGPSGLMAGRILADASKKVLIIERNNYLGGGIWIGGYLMNKVTFRHPSEEILCELGVPYEEAMPGLFVTDGPHITSKLIAAACDAGVKFLQMTVFDDLVLREDKRVCGAVINWTPIQSLPREITCVDPVAMETKLVIDTTGHDACCVKKLEERGLFKTKGFGAMWVEASEDLVVEQTGQVYPGLIVAGMAAATTYGLPRMGPTFGGMLLSGKKAAEIAEKQLAETT